MTNFYEKLKNGGKGDITEELPLNLRFIIKDRKRILQMALTRKMVFIMPNPNDISSLAAETVEYSNWVDVPLVDLDTKEEDK